MSSVLSFPPTVSSAKRRQRTPKGIRKRKKNRKRIQLEKKGKSREME